MVTAAAVDVRTRALTSNSRSSTAGLPPHCAAPGPLAALIRYLFDARLHAAGGARQYGRSERVRWHLGCTVVSSSRARAIRMVLLPMYWYQSSCLGASSRDDGTSRCHRTRSDRADTSVEHPGASAFGASKRYRIDRERARGSAVWWYSPSKTSNSRSRLGTHVHEEGGDHPYRVGDEVVATSRWLPGRPMTRRSGACLCSRPAVIAVAVLVRRRAERWTLARRS